MLPCGELVVIPLLPYEIAETDIYFYNFYFFTTLWVIPGSNDCSGL